jgi:hypothetical protein
LTRQPASQSAGAGGRACDLGALPRYAPHC